MKTTICTNCTHCPNPDMRIGKFCEQYGHCIDGITVIECIHHERRDD